MFSFVFQWCTRFSLYPTYSVPRPRTRKQSFLCARTDLQPHTLSISPCTIRSSLNEYSYCTPNWHSIKAHKRTFHHQNPPRLPNARSAQPTQYCRAHYLPLAPHFSFNAPKAPTAEVSASTRNLSTLCHHSSPCPALLHCIYTMLQRSKEGRLARQYSLLCTLESMPCQSHLARQYSLYPREHALPIEGQGKGSGRRGRHVLVQDTPDARRRPPPVSLRNPPTAGKRGLRETKENGDEYEVELYVTLTSRFDGGGGGAFVLEEYCSRKTEIVYNLWALSDL